MARAECGCRVEIEGTEIHIYPCGHFDHEKALTWAARDLAKRTGIVYVETSSSGGA